MDALLEKPSRSVQMNTRLDALLKKQGDAALAAAGYSPSQAVRSLWTFAARNAAQPKLIGRTLASLTSEQVTCETDERNEKLAIAHAGQQLLDEILIANNIAPGSNAWLTIENEDSLYEEALCERYEERGLL